MDADKNLIKVSATSRATSVAGAIAKTIRDKMHADVQAIGAGAVNQAIKAIAIASNYLEDDKIKICCIPYFTETEIEGNERTAIRIEVKGSRDEKQEGTQASPPVS